MISGSVHFWHWLELPYTLGRVGYRGWIGADVTCKHFGPVEVFGANTLMIERMSASLERIGPGKIAEMVRQEGKTAELYVYMSSFLRPSLTLWDGGYIVENGAWNVGLTLYL